MTLGGYFIDGHLAARSQDDAVKLILANPSLAFEHRLPNGEASDLFSWDNVMCVIGYDSAESLGLLPEYRQYMKSAGLVA